MNLSVQQAAVLAGPVVDAHHHFWDPTRNYHPWLCDEPMIPFRYGDYSSIRRPYLPADYLNDAAPFQISASVYVETEWDPADPVGETTYVHELAQMHGLPNAVVAHVRLDAPDAAELIARQAAFRLVRSIRHKPASSSTPADAARGRKGSMDDPVWRRGYDELRRHALHFDLQTPWWHMDAAAELARDHPDTQIIINHAGLPSDRSAAGLAAWRTAMERMADCANVSVKISGIGLGKGTPWRVEDNGPVILSLIRMFGTDRCMFASNFPVDGVCASFTTIYAGFVDTVQDLTDECRRKLFHENAIRIYRPERIAAD